MEKTELKPYSYFDFLKHSKVLGEKYPFMSVDTIGKSVMGKDIKSFTLGVAEEYVLLVGGIKGSEHFTASVLTAFLEELCLALAKDLSIEGLRVRRALMGRAVIIIPCLNPDGCEIASLGKVGCGNIADKISSLCGGRLKGFDTNVRGADIELDFPLKKQPETAAFASLLNSFPIRHAVLFGRGDDEIVVASDDAPDTRACRMADILSASTGYSVSFAEAKQKDLIGCFNEKYKRPAFKILSRTSGPSLDSDETAKLYSQLRELLMLISIM